MANPSEAGFGVYVHWPFCLSKCPYCDFNSHVRRNPVDEERYVEAFGVEDIGREGEGDEELGEFPRQGREGGRGQGGGVEASPRQAVTEAQPEGQSQTEGVALGDRRQVGRQVPLAREFSPR